MLVKGFLKLGHVPCLASFNKVYVLCELVLLEQCLCREDIHVDLYEDEEFQNLLFVARVVKVAIRESKLEIFSSLPIVVVKDALPPLEVGEHDPPAHGEEILGEGALVRVELHVYPSEEHLTILEVVEAEHQLDGTHSDKEGDVQPIIWG
jgi:hypothetical protein